MRNQLHIHSTSSRLLAGSACVLALLAGQARANPPPITEKPTSWEVEDFDDGSQPNGGNPSGVWSYGYETVLGQSFIYLTQHPAPDLYNPNLDLYGWTGAPGVPAIVHNVNMQPWSTLGGYQYPITVPPRGIVFEPGTSCEYAVIRFTAPYKGRYKLSGQFDGLDGHSAFGLEENVNAYTLINNNPHFVGNIHPTAGLYSASFTPINTAVLNIGDTIDFAVGCGPNNDYWFGATGLRAVVQFQGKLKRP